MTISVFDLFKIGIGPSSSHTVGPMRAAYTFVHRLAEALVLDQVVCVKVELYGSLGATGRGHGSPKAILLGLEGETPEGVDVASMPARIAAIKNDGRIKMLGCHEIVFNEKQDLVLHKLASLPFHPNGMIFSAFDSSNQLIIAKTYYSVGGGFVLDEEAAGENRIIEDRTEVAYPFKTGTRLLELCKAQTLSVSELMWQNEKAWHTEAEIKSKLLQLWRVMQESVQRGYQNDGTLPGGLQVKRRAPNLYRQLLSHPEASLSDPLTIIDWVTLYALAVNEENAAGGRVVTAPTNGAAGIIPAVLHYYTRFVSGANEEGVMRFLLTAAAIGILYKENASISGAEVGCQGEVGAACSMAAGALTEVLGGTPEQVENAAEIAMEHNLGLTCDPIGGLVQVPCIERNAMASVKAISSARMALRGDGCHFVSLDKVIKTMRETGRDMQDKYKETARGGLAINVIEVPVNIIEC